jgi:hypothetical protein
MFDRPSNQFEISEDLLNFLYELDYKASRLPRRAAGTS